MLYEEILTVLQASLNCEKDRVLESLAAHICDEAVDMPLNVLLQTIFHHGVSVADLLSVLLNCESVRMQRLFAGHSVQPVSVQYNNLKDVIDHFNTIQDAVLKEGKGYLLQSEPKVSSSAGSEGLHLDRLEVDEVDEAVRHQILEESLKQWRSRKQIKVYNFFQGVPVYATADILTVEEDRLEVLPSADLIKVFASHPQGNSAYAICADDQDQVRVTVASVSGHRVQLKLEEVAQSLLNCRKNLGVRMHLDVDVELYVRNKKISDVLLRDISFAGLGLTLINMRDEPCRTGEVVECRFTLSGKRIVAHGWVRWVVVSGEEVRLGMELRPHLGVQQALQKEVFQIQRKIIVQLNDLPVPEPLRAVKIAQ